MRLCSLLLAGLIILAAETAADASAVYGIQATTGRILTIDPTSGAVLNSFATPAAIASTQTAGGLSYAAPLNQLLYFNSTASTTLYRLNPTTGAVITTAFGDSFSNSGLSYEQIGGQDFLYYNHTGVDIHRQAGFGGSTGFFFTSGTSTTGLGGDGYGREFAQFSDGTIHEFNPTSGALLNSFTAPTGVLGLAFDGTFLYASTNQGLLLTLNANTGALIQSVGVAGGNLVEIGANAVGGGGIATPEPSGLIMLASAGATLAVFRSRRHRNA